ncbi:hypothetical protein ACFTAO_38345 [Paenibacillus rhizoplanae]
MDNPDTTELSMLDSSPKTQKNQELEWVEAAEGEDLALQVSGVEMLEVIAPPRQTVTALEGTQGTVTEEVRGQEDRAPLLEAQVTAPPEKERLQPVYTDDLSDGAVTGAKIAPRTIDGSRLKHGIIGTPWLQDYAVQNINLADRAVTSSKIAPESVTGEHLAESSVSGGQTAGSLHRRREAEGWQHRSGEAGRPDDQRRTYCRWRHQQPASQ